MFDIDKYLDKMALKEVAPSDALVDRTVARCSQLGKRRADRVRRFRKSLIALPAAALLAAGVYIGAVFFAPRMTLAAPSQYFTVDINPSVCVGVDASGTVRSAQGQNEDGVALLRELDCVGMPVADAIRLVISAAKEAGFLDGAHDAPNYVLIGCFGDSGEAAQAAIRDLQARLEAEFGDMVSLLMLSGTLEDKRQADDLDVSPGLLKLSRMAGGVELTDQAKIGDIVDQVNRNIQLGAPALSAAPAGDGIEFTWTQLDFSAMGYTGKVVYRLLAGGTKAEIEQLNARTIREISFYTNEEQTLAASIGPEDGVGPGSAQYFGICAQYGGNTYVLSNIVRCAMPSLASPTPAATASPSPAPSPAPEQTPDGKVTGRISGQYVVLSWEKDASANFSGYKVVASETNPNPKYPDDGYLKYITNAATTSLSLYAGYGGLQAGHTYYFSVTYLYGDGTRVAANAVRLKVPEKSDPAPTDGAYPASAISGSIAGKTVSLSWTQISDSRLDGYKVMYSFSDTTPVYGESGCNYYAWITDPATIGCTIPDVTELAGYAPNAPCYFSITALYEDHAVKQPGNVLTLTMPADTAEPYIATDITSYSYSEEDSSVHLAWNPIGDDRLEGYKVMCSFTDSSPVYGESGCTYAYWITNGSTSCTITKDFLTSNVSGYESGKTCYFSITALYNSHSVKMAGNTVSLAIP